MRQSHDPQAGGSCYSPLQDIWKRLFVSNFLNTLPFSSTKLLDTMMVSKALLCELMATFRVTACASTTFAWITSGESRSNKIFLHSPLSTSAFFPFLLFVLSFLPFSSPLPLCPSPCLLIKYNLDQKSVLISY